MFIMTNEYTFNAKQSSKDCSDIIMVSSDEECSHESLFVGRTGGGCFISERPIIMKKSVIMSSDKSQAIEDSAMNDDNDVILIMSSDDENSDKHLATGIPQNETLSGDKKRPFDKDFTSIECESDMGEENDTEDDDDLPVLSFDVRIRHGEEENVVGKTEGSRFDSEGPVILRKEVIISSDKFQAIEDSSMNDDNDVIIITSSDDENSDEHLATGIPKNETLSCDTKRPFDRDFTSIKCKSDMGEENDNEDDDDLPVLSFDVTVRHDEEENIVLEEKVPVRSLCGSEIYSVCEDKKETYARASKMKLGTAEGMEMDVEENIQCPNTHSEVINQTLPVFAGQGLCRPAVSYLGVSVPRCISKPAECRPHHHSEPIPVPSSTHFFSMIKTMMLDHKDYKLQGLALLHLSCRGVSQQFYLSEDVMDILLSFMTGYQRMEKNGSFIETKFIPDMTHLNAAFAVLSNQLRRHPPCKRPMLEYYTKIIKNWWWKLMDGMEEALKLHHKSGTFPSPLSENDRCKSQGEGLENLNDDLSYEAHMKRCQQEREYHSLAGVDRLQRLGVTLRYFVDIMEVDVVVWLVKFSNPKAAAFRRDSRPVIASLLWDESRNEGYVNAKCRRLLDMYKTFFFDPYHRRLFSRIISVLGEVFRRKHCSAQKYPRMHEDTVSYARHIYFQLQSCDLCNENQPCGHICGAVMELKPAWLRFIVGTFLLKLSVPANVYILKEDLERPRNGESHLQDNSIFSVTLAAALEMILIVGTGFCKDSGTLSVVPLFQTGVDLDEVSGSYQAYEAIHSEGFSSIGHFPAILNLKKSFFSFLNPKLGISS